jgi:DNA-binding Lrp family transcriptional regulator
MRHEASSRTGGLARRPDDRELARFAIREYDKCVLKAQDVLVSLCLIDAPPGDRAFPKLAQHLGISASEAHAAVKRAVRSGLVDGETRSVRKEALREFLVHGIRYVFPPEWSGVTRGVPTSYAAPPLKEQFAEGDMPPVWPHPEGTVRGEGLAPLYKSAPRAALRDAHLYEWLALVDAVRAGRARERRLAAQEIERRLGG